MPPEQQLAKACIESAQENGRQAAIYFNNAQEKTFENIAKGLQQLSLVAAGTISLSITFLGYLIGNVHSATVLTSTILGGLPILWVLFASWGLLLVSVVLGLLYRIIHAWNWYALAGHAWAERGTEVWNAALAYDDVGGVTLGAEDSGAPMSRNKMEETKRAWIKTTGVFKSAKDRTDFFAKWSRRITIYAFILGLACLLVFVITAANTIASI